MSAPPPYVMLPENHGSGFHTTNIRPPPYRRNIPRYYSDHHHHKKSGGGFCIRCICCCYCALLLIVLIMAGAAFYFYTMYNPQMPKYKVEGLDVKAFSVQPDFSLNTEFVVTVKAENPNEKIGFTYGRQSSVVVFYEDTTLCSGKLPSFHQGYRNMTMMQVSLTGKSEFGSGLQEALMENRKSGRVPMLVMVRAPVSIVLGSFPLRQFVVLLNCSLVLDSLQPNKKPGILSSKYDISFAF